MNSFRGKVTILFLIIGILMLLIFAAIPFLTAITLYNVIIAFITALLVGCIIIYLSLTPLTAHFKMLLHITNKSIAGDLSEQITDQNYGWGEINQLTHNIRKILKGVHKWFGVIKEHSDSLREASTQIIGGTKQVSQGSQEQSEQVRQILHSIADLVKTSREAATLSQNAFQSASLCQSRAQCGGESVQQIILLMNEINHKMLKLNQQSLQISNFLTLINNIAKQTNLLALNAAIEAARAGHQGYGFAVVADEIRGLAESSAQATDEIAKIIGEVKGSVDATTEVVASGLTATSEIDEAINTIVTQIQSTTEMMRKITEFSSLQLLTTEKMATNLESISTVAQEASATSQETAAVTQGLSELRDKISQVADIWKFA